MKLHLPVRLRAALLACCAAVTSIVTTVGSGAYAATFSQLWDFNSSLLPTEDTNTITVKDVTQLVTTTITTSSTAFTDGTWDTTQTYNGSAYNANISGLNGKIGIDGVEAAGATYLSADENGKTLTITLSGLTAGNEYDIALITGAAGMWQSQWGKITTTNATPGTLTYLKNDGGAWGTQSISRWVPSGVFIDGIVADAEGSITITIDQTPSTHRATINALAITGDVAGLISKDLVLPGADFATLGPDHSDTSAEEKLNYMKSCDYGVYANFNGGGHTGDFTGAEVEGTEGYWTGSSIALAGRNGAAGMYASLVLGEELAAGTKINAITLSLTLEADTDPAIDGKTFDFGIGLWNGEDYVDTITQEIVGSATEDKAITLTLKLDEIYTWEDGDKIVVVAVGPGCEHVEHTYILSNFDINVITLGADALYWEPKDETAKWNATDLAWNTVDDTTDDATQVAYTAGKDVVFSTDSEQAKAVEITGAVEAGNMSVTRGEYTFVTDGGSLTVTGALNVSEGASATLDMGDWEVPTVDNKGALVVKTGALTVDNLVNSGTMTANAIQLAADGTLTNSGSLTATDINLAAGGTLTNSGSLTAADINIAADGTLTNSGTLKAADINLAAGGTLTNGSKLIADAMNLAEGGNLSMTGASVTLANGLTMENGTTLSLSSNSVWSGAITVKGTSTISVTESDTTGIDLSKLDVQNGATATISGLVSKLMMNQAGTVDLTGLQLTDGAELFYGEGQLLTLSEGNFLGTSVKIAKGLTLTQLTTGAGFDLGFGELAAGNIDISEYSKYGVQLVRQDDHWLLQTKEKSANLYWKPEDGNNTWNATDKTGACVWSVEDDLNPEVRFKAYANVHFTANGGGGSVYINGDVSVADFNVSGADYGFYNTSGEDSRLEIASNLNINGSAVEFDGIQLSVSDGITTIENGGELTVYKSSTFKDVRLDNGTINATVYSDGVQTQINGTLIGNGTVNIINGDFWVKGSIGTASEAFTGDVYLAYGNLKADSDVAVDGSIVLVDGSADVDGSLSITGDIDIAENLDVEGTTTFLSHTDIHGALLPNGGGSIEVGGAARLKGDVTLDKAVTMTVGEYLTTEGSLTGNGANDAAVELHVEGANANGVGLSVADNVAGTMTIVTSQNATIGGDVTDNVKLNIGGRLTVDGTLNTAEMTIANTADLNNVSDTGGVEIRGTNSIRYNNKYYALVIEGEKTGDADIVVDQGSAYINGWGGEGTLTVGGDAADIATISGASTIEMTAPGSTLTVTNASASGATIDAANSTVVLGAGDNVYAVVEGAAVSIAGNGGTLTVGRDDADGTESTVATLAGVTTLTVNGAASSMTIAGDADDVTRIGQLAGAGSLEVTDGALELTAASNTIGKLNANDVTIAGNGGTLTVGRDDVDGTDSTVTTLAGVTTLTVNGAASSMTIDDDANNVTSIGQLAGTGSLEVTEGALELTAASNTIGELKANDVTVSGSLTVGSEDNTLVTESTVATLAGVTTLTVNGAASSMTIDDDADNVTSIGQLAGTGSLVVTEGALELADNARNTIGALEVSSLDVGNSALTVEGALTVDSLTMDVVAGQNAPKVNVGELSGNTAGNTAVAVHGAHEVGLLNGGSLTLLHADTALGGDYSFLADMLDEYDSNRFSIVDGALKDSQEGYSYVLQKDGGDLKLVASYDSEIRADWYEWVASGNVADDHDKWYDGSWESDAGLWKTGDNLPNDDGLYGPAPDDTVALLGAGKKDITFSTDIPNGVNSYDIGNLYVETASPDDTYTLTKEGSLDYSLDIGIATESDDTGNLTIKQGGLLIAMEVNAVNVDVQQNGSLEIGEFGDFVGSLTADSLSVADGLVIEVSHADASLTVGSIDAEGATVNNLGTVTVHEGTLGELTGTGTLVIVDSTDAATGESVDGSLEISGSATMSTLDNGGSLTVGGDVTITDDVTNGGTLSAANVTLGTDAAAIDGEFDKLVITGTDADDGVTADSLTVGDESSLGKATVTGLTTQGDVRASSITTDTLNNGGTLDVTGDVTVTGEVTTGGTLSAANVKLGTDDAAKDGVFDRLVITGTDAEDGVTADSLTVGDESSLGKAKVTGLTTSGTVSATEVSSDVALTVNDGSLTITGDNTAGTTVRNLAGSDGSLIINKGDLTITSTSTDAARPTNVETKDGNITLNGATNLGNVTAKEMLTINENVEANVVKANTIDLNAKLTANEVKVNEVNANGYTQINLDVADINGTMLDVTNKLDNGLIMLEADDADLRADKTLSNVISFGELGSRFEINLTDADVQKFLHGGGSVKMEKNPTTIDIKIVTAATNEAEGNEITWTVGDAYTSNMFLLDGKEWGLHDVEYYRSLDNVDKVIVDSTKDNNTIDLSAAAVGDAVAKGGPLQINCLTGNGADAKLTIQGDAGTLADAATIKATSGYAVHLVVADSVVNLGAPPTKMRLMAAPAAAAESEPLKMASIKLTGTSLVPVHMATEVENEVNLQDATTKLEVLGGSLSIGGGLEGTGTITGVATITGTKDGGSVFSGSYGDGATINVLGGNQTLATNDKLTAHAAGSNTMLKLNGTSIKMLTADSGATVVLPGVVNAKANALTAETISMNGANLTITLDTDAALQSPTDGPTVITGDGNVDVASLMVNMTKAYNAMDVPTGVGAETVTLALLHNGASADAVTIASTDAATQTMLEKYFDLTTANVNANGYIVLLRNPDYFTEEAGKKNLLSGKNPVAGAAMLDRALVYADPQQNTDKYAQLADIMDAMEGYTAAGNAKELNKLAAAVAGASTASMGAALSDDMQRQLRAIRNRTTTMGVDQCVVNHDMPYFNAWINAEGNRSELDADGHNAGYTMDSWGGTVGFDVDATPQLTFGLALTAMQGDFTATSAETASGDMDTYYLTAFARYVEGRWTHTFVAAAGKANTTLERTVHGYDLKGDSSGKSFGLMYELGYVYALDEDATACLQPVLNFTFSHSSLSGYTEEGGDAALTVGSMDMTTFTIGAGARVQASVGENLYNRTSIMEARALVKFNVGDTECSGSNSIAAIPGSAASVTAADAGAVGLELGAGITIPVGQEGGSLFMDASAEISSAYTNVNGTVGYRINF